MRKILRTYLNQRTSLPLSRSYYAPEPKKTLSPASEKHLEELLRKEVRYSRSALKEISEMLEGAGDSSLKLKSAIDNFYQNIDPSTIDLSDDQFKSLKPHVNALLEAMNEVEKELKESGECSEILTIRYPSNYTNCLMGVARIFIPGLPTPPYNGKGVSVLGSIRSKTLINPYNVYSKSPTYSESSHYNVAPAIPGTAMAYIGTRRGSSSISESEVSSCGSIIGPVAVNCDHRNSSDFQELFERYGKGFCYSSCHNDNNSGILEEVLPDGTTIPANFGTNVISFANRNTEDLRRQDDLLKIKCVNYILESALQNSPFVSSEKDSYDISGFDKLISGVSLFFNAGHFMNGATAYCSDKVQAKEIEDFKTPNKTIGGAESSAAAIQLDLDKSKSL